jgi:hypothetical protein
MSLFLNALAGVLTGVLSAFGIGGGTLLLLYLTFWVGFSQQTAQGINLLYFLPTAATALIHHWKEGLVDREVALWGGLWGCAAAALGAGAATLLSAPWLRRCFGGYLIVTGAMTLLRRKTPQT